MPDVVEFSCPASVCAADSATACAEELPGLFDSDCSAVVKLLSAFSSVPSPPGVP